MVQVSADMSASAVGPAPAAPAAPPPGSGDSFSGHLQQALPAGGASSNAAQPAGPSIRAGAAGNGSAATSSPLSPPAIDGDNPPGGNAAAAPDPAAAAAAALAAIEAQAKSAVTSESAGRASASSDAHPSTHLDNGAGLIPTMVLMSIPLAGITPSPPTPAASTGNTSQPSAVALSGGSSQSSPGTAGISQSLGLAQQALTLAAGTLPLVNSALPGAAKPASQPSPGTAGARVLPAAGALAAAAQTATPGYAAAAATRPIASTVSAAIGTTIQLGSQATADAVAVMLQPGPTTTTQSVPTLEPATSLPDNTARDISPGAGDNKLAPQDAASASGGNATQSMPAALTDPNLAAGRPNAPAANGYAQTAPGASASLSDAGRLRLVQRVARAFHATAAGESAVKLRLSPPELGSLRIEIRVDGGQMSARLDAETPLARDTLLESLPELRDRLQQQDIKVVRFDVGLMGQSPGGSPHTPNRDFDNAPAARRVAMPLDTGGAIDSTPGTTLQSGGDSGLNVVI